MFILVADIFYGSRHPEFLKGSYFQVIFEVMVSKESI